MSVQHRLARLEATASDGRADCCPDCGGFDLERALRAMDDLAHGGEAAQRAGAVLDQLDAAPDRCARCGGPTFAGAVRGLDG